MDRPTCATCPYWMPHDVSAEKGADKGECRRYPPQFAGSDKQFREWLNVEAGYWEGYHQETMLTDWCGEHPDFPAYIAEKRGLTPKGTHVCHETGPVWFDPETGEFHQ